MVDTSDLGSDAIKRRGSNPLTWTIYICGCDGMVDRTDLKSVGEIRAGSSPVARTISKFFPE